MKIKHKYNQGILCKIMLQPVTLWGSEVRTWKENKRIEDAGMRFLRSAAGTTLLRKRTSDIWVWQYLQKFLFRHK